MNYFHVYVAVGMLYLTLLAMNVSRLRMKHKIGNGDGNNVELKKAIRAHMNHLEHALPYGLIVLVLQQMQSSQLLLGSMVFGFLFARALHGYSMLASGFRFRQIAAALTYLFELIGCLIILQRVMA